MWTAAHPVRIARGDPLDAIVLRSYCLGAAHMALGWVTSEGLAVDADGAPHDLTIRSFGILRAIETPRSTSRRSGARVRRCTAPTPSSPPWRPPAG